MIVKIISSHCEIFSATFNLLETSPCGTYILVVSKQVMNPFAAGLRHQTLGMKTHGNRCGRFSTLPNAGTRYYFVLTSRTDGQVLDRLQARSSPPTSLWRPPHAHVAPYSLRFVDHRRGERQAARCSSQLRRRPRVPRRRRRMTGSRHGGGVRRYGAHLHAVQLAPPGRRAGAEEAAQHS